MAPAISMRNWSDRPTPRLNSPTARRGRNRPTIMSGMRAPSAPTTVIRLSREPEPRIGAIASKRSGQGNVGRIICAITPRAAAPASVAQASDRLPQPCHAIATATAPCTSAPPRLTMKWP